MYNVIKLDFFFFYRLSGCDSRLLKGFSLANLQPITWKQRCMFSPSPAINCLACGNIIIKEKWIFGAFLNDTFWLLPPEVQRVCVCVVLARQKWLCSTHQLHGELRRSHQIPLGIPEGLNPPTASWASKTGRWIELLPTFKKCAPFFTLNLPNIFLHLSVIFPDWHRLKRPWEKFSCPCRNFWIVIKPSYPALSFAQYTQEHAFLSL